MRILRLDPRRDPEVNEKSCACIGYFDGLHRGHQELLKEMLKAASERGCGKAVITFDRDPLEVISGKKQKQILSRDSLFSMLEKAGVDQVYLIPFDKEIAAMPAEDFLKDFLYRLQLETLVCGFDFRYGYKGSGNASTLKEAEDRPFEVRIVGEISEDGQKISSTAVKRFLGEGEIGQANRFLGYTYNLEGKVIHGLQNGRRMGFPTVNTELDPQLVLLKTGVYAGYAEANGSLYKAMINLGSNPTVSESSVLHLEAHLLGFEGDLYGEKIRLYFLKQLREEMRFANFEELQDQLRKDRETVLAMTETVHEF